MWNREYGKDITTMKKEVWINRKSEETGRK